MSCPFITSTESLNDSQSLQVSLQPSRKQSTCPVNGESTEVEKTYSDEKERRLAEFVSKKEDINNTNGSEGFKRQQNTKIKGLISGLLKESQKIEVDIFLGENELFHKNEETFFAIHDDQELLYLRTRQDKEIRSIRARQEKKGKDVTSSKGAKKFQRQQQRELKDLYNKTHEQDEAYKEMDAERYALLQHRARSEKMILHIEERHQKQIKQFTASCERKMLDQKVLSELQSRHLCEEERVEAMKEYQSKMNYQKTIDKKALDQIQELQRFELRHLKEKTDLETKMMEEFSNLSAVHILTVQELLTKQRKEYISEKERMNATHISIKMMNIQMENNMEIDKIRCKHRSQISLLQRAQRQRKKKRFKNWSSILGRDLTVVNRSSRVGSAGASQAGSVGSKSQPESASMTRQGSDSNLRATNLTNIDVLGLNTEIEDENNSKHWNIELQQSQAKEQLIKSEEELEKLAKSHNHSLIILREKQTAERKEIEEEFTKEFTELEWLQEVEIKDLKKANQEEIEDALKVQEKELEMENQIRATEFKALVERKVLNSLLDSVVDAVISIDRLGVIKRFNVAAEKMFEYLSSEIVGKNIKELMPVRYSSNHDDYLYNYLSTGVKKVIGIGRDIHGLKKSGEEFAIHLSISEVIEDGFHLFTAIIRDRTEILKEELLQEIKNSSLQCFVWKTDLKGNVLACNTKLKEYTGVFDVTTINLFSTAVVHPEDYKRSKSAFDTAAKNKSCIDMKRRLKGVDGQFQWFRTQASPRINRHGEIVSWHGSCDSIDVGERLQKEFQDLTKGLSQMLWKVDLNGNSIYGNQKLSKYLGVDLSKESVNLFAKEAIHPDDFENSTKAFKEANTTKKAFNVYRRLKNASGTYRWFRTNGNPSLNPDGSLKLFYGTCTDVTEKFQLSLAVKALPESVPSIMCKLNVSGTIVFSNGRFKNILNAKEEKSVLVSSEFVHPEDLNDSLELYKSSTSLGKVFQLTARFKTLDGKYKKIGTRFQPILDFEKDVRGWYAISELVEN